MIYEMDLNANHRVKLFALKSHFINIISTKTSASELKNKYYVYTGPNAQGGRIAMHMFYTNHLL